MNLEYRKMLEPRRAFLKENVLKLADKHSETCNDPECDISIGSVTDLLILAGYEITKEDILRCL